MRDWIERHPEKVNDFDRCNNFAAPFAASNARPSPSFIELVDKYGADVNKHEGGGDTVLHCACSAATVSVLLERGADPTPEIPRMRRRS